MVDMWWSSVSFAWFDFQIIYLPYYQYFDCNKTIVQLKLVTGHWLLVELSRFLGLRR